MSREILKKNLEAFKIKEYHWFRKQGYQAKRAIESARIQIILDNSVDAGTTEFLWEMSADGYDVIGPDEWGWDYSKKEVKKWNETEHECFDCIMKVKGRIEESLSQIIDPDRSTMKMIENDLMSEYLYRIKGILPNHVS
jgi:hypothetical protein